MLKHLLATLTAPLLDARRLPDDTDCWLDTPDEGETRDGDDEPDEDEPLPDDATPAQEEQIAARYAQRRAAYR